MIQTAYYGNYSHLISAKWPPLSRDAIVPIEIREPSSMILLPIVISSLYRTPVIDFFMDSGIPHKGIFLNVLGHSDQLQHAHLTKPWNSFQYNTSMSLASLFHYSHCFPYTSIC